MARRITISLVLVAAMVACADMALAAEKVETPPTRVALMYFHRTQRCPTCKKMGSYAYEAVTERYADQIKAKEVAFYFVNFEDEKNAALTKGYKVKGPTLVAARIEGDKVAKWESLSKIWELAGDKDKFVQYVVESVDEYRAGDSKNEK